MSTETQIRETLAERASSYEISPLSIDDIAGTVRRRTRRSRLAGGATMFTLAALMFAGFGIAGRSTEPSTLMFAGLDGENAAQTPTTILATDDGWLGATLVEGEVYLATSTDGESWDLAEPTGLSATSPRFALDEHEGRYWLATSDTETVQLGFTDDLREWTIADLPAESSDFERVLLDGYRRAVSPARIVANDAGVMLKIDADDQPDFEALIGRDMVNVCDLRWSPVGVSVRNCGSDEWETFEHDRPPGAPVTIVARGGDSNLVFSADGSNFEVFGAATNDTRLPYSAGQRLYETDHGFGLSDYLIRESADGITWDLFDDDSLDRLTSPSYVAARAGKRVASSEVLSMPIAAVMFSADRQVWTPQPIDQLINTTGETRLSERSTPTFTVTALVAGDAGWALAGRSYNGDGDYITLGDTDAAAFTATFDDLTLSGIKPAGPAQLTDVDGEVLRAWEHFEPGTPWRTGVQRDGIDYVVVNDDGDVLLSVPAETWNDAVDVNTPLFTHVVLFSPDGVNWSIVFKNLAPVAGIAVGDDEVIVATRTPLGTSSERIPVNEE